MKHALLLFVAIAAAACSEAPPPAPPPGPAISTTSEAPGDGASVTLRGRPDGDTVLVDILARGAADVHGATFRLTFDPDSIAFGGDITSGPSWSKASLAIAKEATPGLLLVTFAEKGAIGISAKEETVLGTVRFGVRAHRTSTIGIRADRSALMDRDGKIANATFHGATVTSR